MPRHTFVERSVHGQSVITLKLLHRHLGLIAEFSVSAPTSQIIPQADQPGLHFPDIVALRAILQHPASQGFGFHDIGYILSGHVFGVVEVLVHIAPGVGLPGEQSGLHHAIHHAAGFDEVPVPLRLAGYDGFPQIGHMVDTAGGTPQTRPHRERSDWRE